MNDAIPSSPETVAEDDVLSSPDPVWVARTVARFLDGLPARPVPEAWVVAGPPGAGKTPIAEALRGRYADRGHCLVLDPAELLLLHPDYADFAEDDDTTAADALLPDVLALADILLHEALRSRVNLVTVASFRNPESCATLLRILREHGYRTTVIALAVPTEESWRSVEARFQRQRLELGAGRWVDREDHDQACQQLGPTLRRIEEQGHAGAIHVITREGRSLFSRVRQEGYVPGEAEQALRPIAGPESVPVEQPPAPGREAQALDGVRFPGYEMLGLVGRGGMGAVYEARQIKLNRRVAVKILAPELAADPDFVARFRREAEAMALLNHPNIVQVYDFTEVEAAFGIVMEYIEGPAGGPPQDLRTLIDRRLIDGRAARTLLREIASALGRAHSVGIVHRDVKPGNVLIDRDGHARLVDFGIAALVQAREPGARALTQASTGMGTPDYMAPEQRRDAATIDHRADVYSAGVLLYEMLTGDLPLGAFPPPSQAVPGLDPGWDAIVTRAIQSNPEHRFASMAEFAAAIDALESKPNQAPVVSPGISEREEAPGSAAGRDTELFKRTQYQSHLDLGRKLLDSALNVAAAATDDARLLGAEQAAIAFAKAHRVLPDEPEAVSLLDQAKAQQSHLAWNAAESARVAKLLGKACSLYELVLETDPGHPKAGKRLDQIHEWQVEELAKAEKRVSAGELSKGILALEKMALLFPDDRAIADRLAALAKTSTETSDKIRRIEELKKEHKICEVLRLCDDLLRVGIPVEGLESRTARYRTSLNAADAEVALARRALDEGRRDEAHARASKVLTRVADHDEARTVAATATNQVEELRGHREQIGRRLDAGRPYRARAYLRSLTPANRDDPSLTATIEALEATIEGAQRYRNYLIWVASGSFLWAVSDRLAPLILSHVSPALQGTALGNALTPMVLERSLVYFAPLLIGVLLLSLWQRVLTREFPWLSTYLMLLIALGASLICGIAGGKTPVLQPESPLAGAPSGLIGALDDPELIPLILVGALSGMIGATFSGGYLGQVRFLLPVAGVLTGGVGGLILAVPGASSPGLLSNLTTGLMVCGLVPVFGLSRHWSRLLLIPLAAWIATDLEVIAFAGTGPWNVALQGLPTALLIAVATLMSAPQPRWWLLLLRTTLLALALRWASFWAFALGASPLFAVLLSTWTLACGAVAIGCIPQSDCRLHLFDRIVARKP